MNQDYMKPNTPVNSDVQLAFKLYRDSGIKNDDANGRKVLEKTRSESRRQTGILTWRKKNLWKSL